MARWWVVVLVVTLVASGCTALDAPPPDGPDALAGVSEASLAPATDAAQGPPAAPAYARVPLGIEPAWVKPRNLVVLEAASDAAVGWAWFVGTNGSDASTRRVAEFHYLKGGTGEGTRSSQPPTGATTLDTGLLAPGTASPRLTFPKEARYEFEAPRQDGAAFVVTVLDGGAGGVVEVRLVRDGSLRFEPAEVILAPGASVRFLNDDRFPNSVVEARYWARVPEESGARWRLVGVDPGWYEVLGVARTPTGLLMARAPLLVDFESPSTSSTSGPYGGRISKLDPGPRGYPVEASSRVRSLAIDARLTGVPLPAEAEFALLSGADVLATFRLSDESVFVVEDLPRGAYRVEVKLTDGPLADYAFSVHVRYALDLPPAPAWVA